MMDFENINVKDELGSYSVGCWRIISWGIHLIKSNVELIDKTLMAEAIVSRVIWIHNLKRIKLPSDCLQIMFEL
jgi:hypothetical protein